MRCQSRAGARALVAVAHGVSPTHRVSHPADPRRCHPPPGRASRFSYELGRVNRHRLSVVRGARFPRGRGADPCGSRTGRGSGTLVRHARASWLVALARAYRAWLFTAAPAPLRSPPDSFPTATCTQLRESRTAAVTGLSYPTDRSPRGSRHDRASPLTPKRSGRGPLRVPVAHLWGPPALVPASPWSNPAGGSAAVLRQRWRRPRAKRARFGLCTLTYFTACPLPG